MPPLMDSPVSSGIGGALGPRPVGDPAGMRAIAAKLRGVAGPLGSQKDVRLANWESARGRAVRADLSSAVAVAGRVSGEVGRLASLLEREADAVEGDQKVWEARRKSLAAAQAKAQSQGGTP